MISWQNFYWQIIKLERTYSIWKDGNIDEIILKSGRNLSKFVKNVAGVTPSQSSKSLLRFTTGFNKTFSWTKWLLVMEKSWYLRRKDLENLEDVCAPIWMLILKNYKELLSTGRTLEINTLAMDGKKWY